MSGVRGPSRPVAAATPARTGWRPSHVGIVLLVLSAAFFGVNFAQEWLYSHQIQAQAAQLQARINQVRAENAQLQNQIGYYSGKPYILNEARILGMARPGDTLMNVNMQPATVKYVRVPMRMAPPPENFFIRLLRAIFQ